MMIKNLKISNFRCFDNFDIHEFERVNLIGGRNNSGKTALLEALYLNSAPSSKTIMNLRQIRSESLEFLKTIPAKAWDYLFFDKSKLKKIIKIVAESEEKIKEIEIVCDDSIEQFEEFFENEDEDEETQEIEELKTILIENENKRSVLNIYTRTDTNRLLSASMIANSKGVITKTQNISSFNDVNFIPSFLRITNPALAEEFDKADLEGYSDDILKIVQSIDSSIEQIKTLNIGKSSIYLKKQTNEYLPITLFGEAVYRVIQFALRIVNNRNGILLVDEIENGIHYTSQDDLWTILFQLAINFNIQIFATTHSYEMIKSFSKIAHKFESETGAYFEIAKSAKKNKTIAIKRDIEVLKYELSQEMEFRGE
ncbi:MAG: AAA family ATPase [Desulfamplus sp.]|nr:AAA family ATPase [Desulfamplus sp.]